MADGTEGDLRIWFIDRRGIRMSVPVRTPVQGRLSLDMHRRVKDNPAVSEDQLDASEGMEVFRDGCWTQWTDDQGRTVATAFNEGL